jgi:AraC-like DNA-binding protein
MSGTVHGALVKLVLSGARRHGADPRVLAREASLPGWALADDEMRFPSAQLARLWQVTAARLEEPRIGLRVAAGWQLGDCRLGDYLFDTAGSLGEAFTAAFAYAPLLNSAAANDGTLTDSGTVRYQIGIPDAGVNTIVTEFILSSLMQRARYATGRPVTPSRVEFAGAAPRSHGELADAFGTDRIDFGAEVSTMTFSRADLDVPLLRADPALAQILRRVADAQLAVPERIPRWIVRFRAVLAECLDDQDMLLGAAALRLHVSPRTLQRLLEREGTTWRAEVDAARREQAARLRQAGATSSQAASRLGYSDVRSLRRAARRWQRSGEQS